MYKFTQTYTISKKPIYSITSTANKIKLDSKEPVEVNEPEMIILIKHHILIMKQRKRLLK